MSGGWGDRGPTISAAGSTADSGTILFDNSPTVTFGMNGNTITASAAGGGGDAVRGIAAGGSTLTTSTVLFNNLNGISFGFQAAGNSTNITASYTVPTVTNSSWTASDSATSVTISRLAFTNSNGLTLTLSTGAGAATVVGSHNGLTSQSTDFNAITLGGNTAGTTTFHATNNRTIWLNGGNNITLSGNGSTITISAANAGADVTISHWPAYPVDMATSANNTGTTAQTGGSTQTTARFSMFPFQLLRPLSYSRIDIIQSFQSVAGTGSNSIAHMLGIYTLNGGTRFDSVSTFFARIEISQNSVSAQTWRWYWGTDSTSNSTQTNGNISSNFTAPRKISLYGTGASLAASQYWMAYAQVNRSSSVAVWPGASMQCMSVYGSQVAGELGSASSTPPAPYLGWFSTTTNVNVLTTHCIPATIHTSVLNMTATSQWQWPFVLFRATTN